MGENMTNVLKVLCFALGLGFFGAAFAQSADTPDGESAPTEAEVETPSEPTPGQTFVAGTFSDWELRCLRLESGADRCQMYQLLIDGTGQAVAEVNFFAIPETLLTADLRLAVDLGEIRRYPYSFCTTEGCVARLGFTPEEIAEFKRGVTGKVTIVPALAPDQTVDLTMSLSGFTAAYNDLRTRAGL
jgi:invasion protein IalB